MTSPQITFSFCSAIALTALGLTLAMTGHASWGLFSVGLILATVTVLELLQELQRYRGNRGPVPGTRQTVRT